MNFMHRWTRTSTLWGFSSAIWSKWWLKYLKMLSWFYFKTQNTSFVLLYLIPWKKFVGITRFLFRDWSSISSLNLFFKHNLRHHSHFSSWPSRSLCPHSLIRILAPSPCPTYVHLFSIVRTPFPLFHAFPLDLPFAPFPFLPLLGFLSPFSFPTPVDLRVITLLHLTARWRLKTWIASPSVVSFRVTSIACFYFDFISTFEILILVSQRY